MSQDCTPKKRDSFRKGRKIEGNTYKPLQYRNTARRGPEARRSPARARCSPARTGGREVITRILVRLYLVWRVLRGQSLIFRVGLQLHGSALAYSTVGSSLVLSESFFHDDDGMPLPMDPPLRPEAQA